MNSYTNTVTYANQTQQGNNIGISAQQGGDIKMVNNISVIDATWGGFALSAGGVTNLMIKNNLIFGLNGNISQDPDVTSVDNNTTIIADPLFVNVANDNFKLKENSPAIDVADPNFAPPIDFFGHTRDANPDIGAVEFFNSLLVRDQSYDQLKIYPNPFLNKIIINQPFMINELSIFNLLGQKVDAKFYYKTMGQNTEIFINKIPSGTYILRIGDYTKIIQKL